MSFDDIYAEQTIFVGKTPTKGMGLFTKKIINKDEKIFTVKGELRKDEYDDNYMVGERWISVGKNQWIDPNTDNPLCFLNHSCEPNAGFGNGLTVVAMRKINRGEEITIDYSTTEEDPYWKMDCKCGLPCCRKTIRSIQSLPKELFDKYKPYIFSHLKASYLENLRSEW
ncbi:SET domain-containing protein-lysine N-methyltransferase [Patescibacteria group bacterium]|nr:SET domain-containing protein-lysine N-methyltransferase [Patescibacteria group bacterium]